jgi:hypothetical protein
VSKCDAIVEIVVARPPKREDNSRIIPVAGLFLLLVFNLRFLQTAALSGKSQ